MFAALARAIVWLKKDAMEILKSYACKDEGKK